MKISYLGAVENDLETYAEEQAFTVLVRVQLPHVSIG